MKSNFYIQYHNADKKGRYPYNIPDFKIPLNSVSLKNSTKYKSQFYTKKSLVEKAVGQYCFLIVGKTERIKKYSLWAYFKIEDYIKDEDGYYEVNGTGYNFKNPIFLNDLPNFPSFRSFCGNFGFGFYNIGKHSFCKTLISFSKHILDSNKNVVNVKDNLELAIQQLSKEMQKIEQRKRLKEIELILRKDGKIVKLLKKSSDYKCQFPNCKSEILTKKGVNYVEVAHVKPVHKGGKSTIGNLVVLCPNHHKEFDLGYLKIEKQTNKRLEGILNGKKFNISQKFSSA